jgi:hypothetical protein
MFAIISNNQFVKFLPENTPFKLDGTQFPANYLNLSTPDEKSRLGIVDVVYGQRADDKYYWVSEDAPVVDGGVVKVNYINTPKDLFESQNQAVSAVNAAAYSLLSPSDWRVVKSFETGVTQDPKWSAWRQAVRDTANDAITTITMCLTVDELSALTSIQWPHDPDYVAPVEQLPIA